MTMKERVAQLVEELSEEQAADALMLLQGLLAAPAPVAPAVEGADVTVESAATGHVLTPDSSLLKLIGIMHDGPTDMAENHDRYLAEAYADLHDK